MKTTQNKKFVPRFLSEKESMKRLKKNRPDLYETLKKPSLNACLGANVSDIRHKRGISQKDLADKAKISFRTLQRIEQAQPTSNPRMGVVESLSRALKVDVTFLFKMVDLTKSMER